MSKNTAQTKQTDPTLAAIDNVVKLSSLIPIPGIQKIIKPLNKLVKMFTPSPAKIINKELNEINQKLDSVYGLVQQALTEDDIKSLMRDNVSLFIQIQDVELAVSPPDWKGAMDKYSAMVKQYTTAAQQTNDFLKHYEKANKNDSGYLINYMGGFVNTMCQFYSMYALLQHTTNILMNKYLTNQSSTKEQVSELLDKEQKVIIDFVSQFINRALGKESTIFFNFNYPSWCKNVFTQGKVNISSLDGRPMKYPADSKDQHICLSQSYFNGTVCEEFEISFVDIENPEGMWELILKSNNHTGLIEITDANQPGYTPSTNQYLVTDQKSRFIIKYDHTAIIICLVDNNKATSSHLGAEAHHARNVWATTSSYKWNIVSLS